MTANDLYAGESYDARLQQNGWDRPGFADASWHPVRTVAAPSATLTAATAPPIRVVQTLRAVSVKQPRPGVHVYDFGQNFAGWAQLRVAGPAGTTVRMRTAEEVGADGMLDTSTNRNAASTDSYTLGSAAGTQVYEPRFTYHGFRYLELTGFPGTPDLGNVAGRVAHADVAATGRVETSDPLLNTIWANNRRAVLNNSMSLPTDNPVRDERTPPGMDVQAYHDAAVLDFGMDGFYGKYLQDLPPGTALPSDAGNAQLPDMGGGSVDLAWSLYEQYGDLGRLAATYPKMTAFVDTNAAAYPGRIWPDDRGFGDWCPPDRGPNANGGQETPRRATASASGRSSTRPCRSGRPTTSRKPRGHWGTRPTRPTSPDWRRRSPTRSTRTSSTPQATPTATAARPPASCRSPSASCRRTSSPPSARSSSTRS